MAEVQYWSTDLMPEQDRFDAWAERVRTLHMDWDLASPVASDYAARIRYRESGGVRLADVRCAAFEGQRDPVSDNSAMAGFQLQVSGRMTCQYRGEQFSVEPGDLFMWDSLEGGRFQSSGPHRQLSLMIPLARVPKAVAEALRQGRPLSAKPGAGMFTIAAGHLRSITQELDSLNDDAVNATAAALLDMLDVALKPAVESTTGQRQALLAEIQAYIIARLDDSRVSVSSIAAAHNVSVRTLHLVFSEAGTPVARWIRQQRLERCRRELVSASAGTTVTDVAFRWGFSDTSHFSRVFKQEYGVPPTAVMPH